MLGEHLASWVDICGTFLSLALWVVFKLLFWIQCSWGMRGPGVLSGYASVRKDGWRAVGEECCSVWIITIWKFWTAVLPPPAVCEVEVLIQPSFLYSGNSQRIALVTAGLLLNPPFQSRSSQAFRPPQNGWMFPLGCPQALALSGHAAAVAPVCPWPSSLGWSDSFLTDYLTDWWCLLPQYFS